jgi:hypothetical protein
MGAHQLWAMATPHCWLVATHQWWHLTDDGRTYLDNSDTSIRIVMLVIRFSLVDHTFERSEVSFLVSLKTLNFIPAYQPF